MTGQVVDSMRPGKIWIRIRWRARRMMKAMPWICLRRELAP